MGIQTGTVNFTFQSTAALIVSFKAVRAASSMDCMYFRFSSEDMLNVGSFETSTWDTVSSLPSIETIFPYRSSFLSGCDDTETVGATDVGASDQEHETKSSAAKIGSAAKIIFISGKKRDTRTMLAIAA
jgi:hypothetical protein